MESYLTEKDILFRVKEQLKNDGISTTNKQLEFMYSVIVRFLHSKSEDPSCTEIRLPHLGVMYKKDFRSKTNKKRVPLTSMHRFTDGKDLFNIIKLQNENTEIK